VDAVTITDVADARRALDELQAAARLQGAVDVLRDTTALIRTLSEQAYLPLALADTVLGTLAAGWRALALKTFERIRTPAAPGLMSEDELRREARARRGYRETARQTRISSERGENPRDGDWTVPSRL